MRNLNVSGSTYILTSAGRRNTVVGVMGAGLGRYGAARREGPQYEVFDADDESLAGSHSGTGSSVGSCYDDAPSDGIEDRGREGELAFGDRIY